MDGTLLNEDHSISPATMATLFELSTKFRVEFIFATGRHYLSVLDARTALHEYYKRRLAEPHEGATPEPSKIPTPPGFYLVSSNGARVHDRLGHIVVQHDLPSDIVKALYHTYGLPFTTKRGPDVQVEAVPLLPSANHAAAGPHGTRTATAAATEDDVPVSPVMRREGDDEQPEEAVSISAYTTDRWVMTSSFLPLEEMERKFGVRPEVMAFDPVAPQNARASVFDQFPTEGVGKICFRCSDRDILDTLEQRITAEFGSRVSVALSSTRCLDVMRGGVSKASAIAEIVAMLNKQRTAPHPSAAASPPLSLHDVISFGDSMNDEAMLAASGKGCIMKNASSRLKAVLPQCEVIGNHNDDAVAAKLREVFGLVVSS